MPDQILHQSEFKRRVQKDDGRVVSTYRIGPGWAQDNQGQWVDSHQLVSTSLVGNEVEVEYDGARGFNSARFTIKPVVSGQTLDTAAKLADAGITLSVATHEIGGGQKWDIILDGVDPDTIEKVLIEATPAAVFQSKSQAAVGDMLRVSFADLERVTDNTENFPYELSVSGRTLTIQPVIDDASGQRHTWTRHIHDGRLVLDPTTVYVPENAASGAWREGSVSWAGNTTNDKWGWPGPVETVYSSGELSTVSEESGSVTQGAGAWTDEVGPTGPVRTAHRFKVQIDEDPANVASIALKALHSVTNSWAQMWVDLYLAIGKPTAEEWEDLAYEEDGTYGTSYEQSGAVSSSIADYIEVDGADAYVYLLAAHVGESGCGQPVQEHNLFYAEVEVEEGAAADPAEVSTLAATDVTHNSATLNGEVTDMGGLSEATVRFQYREQGAAEWITTGGQAMTATGTFSESIAGLDPETDYEFRAAVNGGTPGSTLTLATAAEPSGPSAPAAPTNLAAAATGIDSVQLTWDAPPRGGPKVTGYRIERESPVGDGWVTLVANTGDTATAYLDEGLTSATEYNYRVAAINSAGLGSYSGEDAATTEPPFAPGKPTNFLASHDPETGDASLSWDAPVDDGGAAITSYRITRIDADGLGETVDTGSTSTSYTDEDLDHGTWTYSVQAVNSVGAGESSDPQTVVVESPAGDPSLLDPAVLKAGLTTPDGASLKSSLIRPGTGYSGGAPTAEQLRAGLLTEDGEKLKPGMLTSDGDLKPSLLRQPE